MKNKTLSSIVLASALALSGCTNKEGTRVANFESDIRFQDGVTRHVKVKPLLFNNYQFSTSIPATNHDELAVDFFATSDSQGNFSLYKVTAHMPDGKIQNYTWEDNSVGDYAKQQAAPIFKFMVNYITDFQKSRVDQALHPNVVYTPVPCRR